jgi:molybdate transport system substrate-binding protein
MGKPVSILLGLVCCLANLSAVSAAEIRVFSGGNMATILNELRRTFEKSSGHTLAIEYMSAGQVQNRIQNGEAADAIVVLETFSEPLAKAGKIEPVTRVANSSVGVVVKTGAPKPDVSNREALKQTLLAAKSVAYIDPRNGAPGGIFFAGVIEGLGIATEVMAKAKLQTGSPPMGGASVAEAVAKGEAELGVGQVSELMTVPGVEFVTPIATELQQFKAEVSAAVVKGSREPQAAAAFIKFLISPEAAPVIRAKGMQPAIREPR